MQGIVCTDVVPHPVDKNREWALGEGILPPVLTFAVENARHTSYADESFACIIEKARMLRFAPAL